LEVYNQIGLLKSEEALFEEAKDKIDAEFAEEEFGGGAQRRRNLQ
jgi:hypothetical protein